ncbi:hypothetical protein SADUNF_Sadunf10G0117100 [Salix dunnii]|uniref:Protein kinase domain-containing protein n=1 Tax=Salix dunnii TaxID=1413687 RepID=A0A835JNC9_9ROSI|nr:hypothetical protein SADUNF_Sadunf10G0117100 [Salix dunnii]
MEGGSQDPSLPFTSSPPSHNPNGDRFDLIVTNQIILSKNQARCLFNQLMQTISHCHEYRVVHRDIKPENVILDSGYSVYMLHSLTSLITLSPSDHTSPPSHIRSKLHSA